MLLTGALDDATGPDLFMKSDQYRKSWRKTQALADKLQVLEEMVVRISAFVATEAEVVYGIAKLGAWSSRFAV